MALVLSSDPATVTLVHVEPPFRLPYQVHDRSGAIWGGDVRPLFERVREGLRASTPSPIAVETRVEAGGAGERVVVVGDEVIADLITVGSHGPGCVERCFVGSVAANILYLAACSVLAVPEAPAEERVRLEVWMAGTVLFTGPVRWAELLEAFSRRNAGRHVSVAIDDPKLGAQMNASGYALRGVAYDGNDRRVEIMLGNALGETADVTCIIEEVVSLSIAAAHDGRDRALEVRHVRGHTLVVFDA